LIVTDSIIFATEGVVSVCIVITVIIDIAGRAGLQTRVKDFFDSGAP